MCVRALRARIYYITYNHINNNSLEVLVEKIQTSRAIQTNTTRPRAPGTMEQAPQNKQKRLYQIIK